jgi:RNA polymerase sigma factor (sigma-70 family)
MRKLSHEDLRAARDRQDWNTLWLQSIPLVKFSIKKMMSEGEVDPFWAREDLLQEGMLAAGLAVRSWDTIEGAFSSWVTLKVRGHLLDHLNRNATNGMGGKDADVTVASLHEIAHRTEESETTRQDELAYDVEVFAPPETAAEAAALRRLMVRLTSAEADVVARTFGLGGAEPQSLREVAEHYGVSHVMLRKRLKRAVERLTDTL